MKKALLFLCLSLMTFTSVCAAEEPEPRQHIVLFYKVTDNILQCQNADENMVAGQEELEKELKNHYGKRFIVDEVRRKPLEPLWTAAEFVEKVKFNQVPFVVQITLEGQGQSTDLYQNAFGARAAGVAPTVYVHLIESIADKESNTFYGYDYGGQPYGYGTFTMGGYVFAAEKDPRKNTKAAVRASFRDACKLNKAINKYASPAAYQQETDRFAGNFKPISVAKQQAIEAQNARIEKFKAWCSADPSRQPFLNAINATGVNATFAINFINHLISTGVYKE